MTFKDNDQDIKFRISQKINLLSAKRGFGLDISPYNISDEHINDLLLSLLHEKYGDLEWIQWLQTDTLPFHLRTSPMHTDIEETLHQKIDEDTSNLEYLQMFLIDLWTLPEIIGATFVIWDIHAGESYELERKKIDFDQFIDLIKNSAYYDNINGKEDFYIKYEVEGIYIIEKQL